MKQKNLYIKSETFYNAFLCMVIINHTIFKYHIKFEGLRSLTTKLAVA